MQQAIMLGSAVHCTDGTGGSIRRIVFNPNRSRVDYLLVDQGQRDGQEHYVPIGCISNASAEEIKLTISTAELTARSLSEPTQTENTIQSNLADLCVADEQTAVQDSEGNPIGHLRGVAIDSDYQVTHVLLAERPDAHVPITQFVPCDEGALRVELVKEVGV